MVSLLHIFSSLTFWVGILLFLISHKPLKDTECRKPDRNRTQKQFGNEIKRKVNWNVPAEVCACVWFNALTLVCYFNEYSVSADCISFLYIPMVASLSAVKCSLIFAQTSARRHNHRRANINKTNVLIIIIIFLKAEPNNHYIHAVLFAHIGVTPLLEW